MYNINEISIADHWIVYLIGLITLSALIVLFIMLSARASYKISHVREQAVYKSLIVIISDLLNKPSLHDKHLKRLKKAVKQPWKRDILLKILTMGSYNFSGDYHNRLKQLYQDFELQKVSTKKLESQNWYEIIDGITELSVLGDTESYTHVKPLLDHSNPDVRRHAKIAMVEIGEAKGLLEMKEKIGVMSRWTFISILSVLQRSAYRLKPDQLEVLRNSGNPSMRKLANHLQEHSVAY